MGRMKSESFKLTLNVLGLQVECWAIAYYLQHQNGITLDRVHIKRGQGESVNVTPLLSREERRAVSAYIDSCWELQQIQNGAAA